MKFTVVIYFTFLSYTYTQFQFSNATKTLLPDPHFSGSVVGIADMDADGLDDVIRLINSKTLSIACQRGPGIPFKINRYGDQGNAQFWTVSVGDINQDGLQDMVFAANQNIGAVVLYGNRIGDSIRYIAQRLDSSETVYAQAANLVDINQDGWLDYFLCNDIGINKIWANQSGMIGGNPVGWIDFNTIPPSDNSGNYGSVWSDFDMDGDLDLYIAKCKGGVTDPKDPRRVNTYYQNNGRSGFVERASELGIASGAQSWIAISGDSDNDGDMDLFVLNRFSASHLYINDGKGRFTDQYAESGIQFSATGMQAAWVDLDNDGWLDLIISGSQHQIYKNLGQNKYQLTDSRNLGVYQMESFALGDLNQDGRQDIYASYSLIPNEASHRPDAIWLNSISNQNHYLKIRLEGVVSNRSAIGAKIFLYAGGMKQMREIQSGMAYGIQHSLTQSFGLGAATKIDSVVIHWPAGSKEKIIAPFIDRTLVVKEQACFGFDPILSSLPDIEFICTPQDSFQIGLSIAGNYLWNTGSNQRTIVPKSAGTYQARVITADGCTLYSNARSIRSNPDSKYRVLATDTVVCEGTAIQLEIQSPYGVVWNNGDTLKKITVTKAGTYFATAKNECAARNTDTVKLRWIEIPDIKVKNDTVGVGAKANLRAEGNSLFWFENPTGGPSIAQGNSYTTLPLNKTTHFYVQSILNTPRPKFQGGIKDFTGPSKFSANTFSARMLFDLQEDIILESVKVYSDTAASREIVLLGPRGVLLNSKVIRIEKGESTIPLGFRIPPGVGYQLATNDSTSIKVFGDRSPRLYRTEGAISYPIVSGPLSIYGTNAGAVNYYYFYDWKMSYPDLVCNSERQQVSAVLRTVSAVDEVEILSGIYPNPAIDRIQINLKNRASWTKFEILDLTGHTVASGRPSVAHNTIQILFSGLPSGLYLLRLTNKKERALGRFTVLQ
jgi:hypothetical protein